MNFLKVLWKKMQCLSGGWNASALFSTYPPEVQPNLTSQPHRDGRFSRPLRTTSYSGNGRN